MKYHLTSLPIIIFFGLLFVGCAAPDGHQTASEPLDGFDAAGWQVDSVDHEELIKWPLLGDGKVFSTMGAQTFLTESEGSQGVMLLSPTYYNGDVVVKYKALALTDATVFVTILSATDSVAATLEIPEDYDGGMALWINASANYFFAFKNAPHGGTPYIAKNPGFSIETTASEQDRMVAGVYYDIEVGKQGDQLWLSIDGQKVLDWKDDNTIENGHVAIRLRGTAGLPATGLIKDLVIYSK